MSIGQVGLERLTSIDDATGNEPAIQIEKKFIRLRDE